MARSITFFFDWVYHTYILKHSSHVKINKSLIFRPNKKNIVKRANITTEYVNLNDLNLSDDS